MCGITGYLGGARPPLAAALASLRHRGPDGQGLWEGELAGQQAGLAHARLAVIDLSPAGRQPMETADGKLRLVFNGEIYNFRELRRELERLGHAFRTQSDTEVILVGYRQWGDAVVSHLRGMFAFALYDSHAQRALLARDRLGIKPLYYQALPGSLRFASEAKGVLAMLPERPAADPYALRDYLTYLYVPYPRSIWQGLAQLPPAHVLVWESGRARLDRYWRLPAPEPAVADERELALELRALLEETVRLHLASDVPLGAFLSGGLDSTTLVALMARQTSKRVKTFCMTFAPDAGLYDEREYARAVADAYGTDHTEIPVEPDLTELLPHAIAHFDEPFGNPTSLLVDRLSQKTREHVTVALAGDGGDECFLGYPRYQGAAAAELYRWLPEPLRRAAAGRLAPLIPESTRGRHSLRRAREFLQAGILPPDEAYARWVTYFTAEEQEALLDPEILEATRDYDPYAHLRSQIPASGGTHRSLVDSCQAVDLATFLPGNLLTYSDRMSMAHGLEVRVPFCDHVLVERLARLPASVKMPFGRTKALLRRAVADLLPEKVRRRPKLGFNPPVGVWIDQGLGLLARGREPPFLRPGALAGLVREHRSGARDRSLAIWSLLALRQWSEAGAASRSEAPRETGGP
ncbi:MAG: asparagine synthase (glutamine-hydrolyzing) [Myxococcales bacterium]